MEIQLLRTVWLLRHGQESPERPKPLGGFLTELGRQQAELTAERLASIPFDRIVASTLHRAAETAQIVATCHSGVNTEYTEDLWECVPAVPPHLVDYFAGVTPEMIAASQARLDRAYQHYFVDETTPETTLLVCHGNVIRYLICRALDLPIDAWARFDLFNCSLARLEWKTLLGRQLTGFNDVGHLPSEMWTYG